VAKAAIVTASGVTWHRDEEGAEDTAAIVRTARADAVTAA